MKKLLILPIMLSCTNNFTVNTNRNLLLPLRLLTYEQKTVKVFEKEFQIQSKNDTDIIKTAAYFKIHRFEGTILTGYKLKTTIHYLNSSKSFKETNPYLLKVINSFNNLPKASCITITFYDKFDNLIAIATMPNFNDGISNEAEKYAKKRLDKSVKLVAYKAEISKHIKLGRTISFYDNKDNCLGYQKYEGSETLTAEQKNEFEKIFNIDLKFVDKAEDKFTKRSWFSKK